MHSETIRYYDLHAPEIVARHREADITKIHQTLHRWLPAGGRVLEIGCGSGREAVFMASLGFQVTATDASQGMLEEASRLAREHKETGLVEFEHAAFPLEQGHPLLMERYEVIACLAVFMHLP